jgi:hypothetical protein
MRFIAKKHPKGYWGVWDKERKIFVDNYNGEPLAERLEFTVNYDIQNNLEEVTRLADRPLQVLKQLNRLNYEH